MRMGDGRSEHSGAEFVLIVWLILVLNIELIAFKANSLLQEIVSMFVGNHTPKNRGNLLPEN